MQMITLCNGLEIPQVGLGTWQISDREAMKELLSSAFDTGYRLFDTAAAYRNEIALGKAVEYLQLPRKDLFLSDKVWNTYRSYEKVQEACRKSLKKLKTDYLDIYLVHWPASIKLHPDWAEINADTWRGMERLYEDGLVRAIGVCNFKPHHLEELKKTANIMPMLNQMEYHPGMGQQETAAYCREEGIAVEASSPLGNGQILQNPLLLELAAKHGKSPAQICLRWATQRDVIVIPKTGSIQRLRENFSFFDFKLSEDELASIDTVPYCGGLGIDPDEVTEYG